MVDAVVPRWHGDNYQSRVFWQNALNLRRPHSCVVEVTFEADGPKAFDDVVVRYDPAVPGSGSGRVTADYHQVKWHTDAAGRFGYADLVDPAFIGAVTVSILERLRDASRAAEPTSRFSFITVYRIKDGDPLAKLVSANDSSILVERLFDGTGDRSRMGMVRKLWREHLGLDDTALRGILAGFRIFEGHRSLDQLRRDISITAEAVGLLAIGDDTSDFRFDELARSLKARMVNRFDRASFERLLGDEGLLAPAAPAREDVLEVAVRSFLGPAADACDATPDDTLVLAGEFRERYLQDGRDWQRDIRPRVEAFLRERMGKAKGRPIRLSLDAHASIAFLAGAVMDFKSGADVCLVQKGRPVASRTWRPDDGTSGPRPEATLVDTGAGSDLAVAISITHDVGPQVSRYVSARLPSVGRTITFAPARGPSVSAVTGGGHAAAVAEAIAQGIRAARGGDPDHVVHVFAACPNSLLFFLGQHHRTVAPAIVYEFDFDRRGNKSYQPSFVVD